MFGVDPKVGKIEANALYTHKSWESMARLNKPQTCKT
jgi:hypothetical protein